MGNGLFFSLGSGKIFNGFLPCFVPKGCLYCNLMNRGGSVFLENGEPTQFSWAHLSDAKAGTLL